MRTFRKHTNNYVKFSAAVIQDMSEDGDLSHCLHQKDKQKQTKQKNTKDMHRSNNTTINGDMIYNQLGPQAPKNIFFDFIQVETKQRKRLEYRLDWWNAFLKVAGAVTTYCET